MDSFLKIIQISSFEMLGVVIYLIASLVIFIRMMIKKVAFNKILIGSLFIGILGAISIHFLNMSGETKAKEVSTWLNIFPEVFFYLILLITPVLLSIKITHLILNNKTNLKFNYMFYVNILVVFLSIGIVVPLLSYVSFPTESLKKQFGFINWIIANDKKFTPYWYLSIAVFASIIIIPAILGFSILYAKKKSIRYTFEKTNEVFSSFKLFLEYVISCISKILPMVLVSIIPLFFYDDANAKTNLFSTLKFIGIFVIASLILTSVLKIINKKNKFSKQNISLLISTLFLPMILFIISFFNKDTELINLWKISGFIFMFLLVSTINYITYYKELTHTDNFLETAAERSITIVLGSFSLISNIYLYLLIMKPLYLISEIILNKLLKSEKIQYINSVLSRNKDCKKEISQLKETSTDKNLLKSKIKEIKSKNKEDISILKSIHSSISSASKNIKTNNKNLNNIQKEERKNND